MSAQAPATISDCLPLVGPTPDMRPLPSDSGMGSGAPQRVLEATVSLHARRHSESDSARRIGFASKDARAGPELLAALGVGRVGIGAAGEAPSRQLCLIAAEALESERSLPAREVQIPRRDQREDVLGVALPLLAVCAELTWLQNLE